jgi:ATP-dependent DNA ligase
MLAKLATEIPHGVDSDGASLWSYEPKWDGFRCIVFRSGDELYLASRNERPFNRYFPELLQPLLDTLPDRCVVDGEIVLPALDDRGLDFDALQQRIHPAESRVRRLAAETPACFVAFDLLAIGDRSLMTAPLHERYALLDSVLPTSAPPVYRCPRTTDPIQAQRWFSEFEGAGLDGVIGKRLADPYTPDKRTLVKVKHQRTADCVIGGYRIHKDGNGVGSLLLGLYDDQNELHHVGVTASFTVKRRAELLAELEPFTHDAVVGHPWQGWIEMMQAADARTMAQHGGSRWQVGKDLSFVPLRAELVAEVTFGQLQERRFRHGSQFIRWRPDRLPSSCRYDQLDVATPVPFRALVGQ